MPDELYQIQVNFFTKDNVASLEQFRDNISNLASQLQAQGTSTAGGKGGILANILIGAVMGRALGKAKSSLGNMTRDLNRQKAQRAKGIADRRATREKNIYNDPYVKNVEKANEALEKKMMDETNAARKQGYQDAQKENAKKAFEKMEKLPLESAQKPKGEFKFTNEAKENRRKVIQLVMDNKLVSENLKNSNMMRSALVDENKNLNMMRSALVDENKNLTSQMKEVTSQMVELEKKTSESKVARSLGQQTRRQRESIQMGKEPKELTPEAQALQTQKQTASDLTKQQTESMWAQQEQQSMPPVEPPPAPLFQKPSRNPSSVMKGQEKKATKSYLEQEDETYKLRGKEQAQTATGDY
jgi:hypothetical protein